MPGMKCNPFPATAIAENTATAAQTHRFWADCIVILRILIIMTYDYCLLLLDLRQARFLLELFNLPHPGWL
jgi:hypothetical protein